MTKKSTKAKRKPELRLVYDSGTIPHGVAYIPNSISSFMRSGIEKPLTVIVLPKAGRSITKNELEFLQKKFGDDLEIFRSISGSETIIFTIVTSRTHELAAKLAKSGWPVMGRKVTVEEIEGVARKELGNSFLRH